MALVGELCFLFDVGGANRRALGGGLSADRFLLSGELRVTCGSVRVELRRRSALRKELCLREIADWEGESYGVASSRARSEALWEVVEGFGDFERLSCS